MGSREVFFLNKCLYYYYFFLYIYCWLRVLRRMGEADMLIVFLTCAETYHNTKIQYAILKV